MLVKEEGILGRSMNIKELMARSKEYQQTSMKEKLTWQWQTEQRENVGLQGQGLGQCGN